MTEGDDDETLAFGCAHSNQTASGTSAAKPLDELLSSTTERLAGDGNDLEPSNRFVLR
jgi:hypothetical protein